MIRIDCDNCDRPFEVDSAQVGGKVACPHCGDVNRVPAQGPAEHAAPGAPAPQPAARPWPAELPPDAGPEEYIRTVRPAMFRAHPFRGLALAGMVAGGAVLATWSLPAADMSRTLLGWLGLLMAGGAALWLAVWYVGGRLGLSLRISNKRTVRREGILRRNTTEVLHDHVREVEIKQGLIQRVFNVGYLGISSAAQGSIEIEVRDIPAPYEVKALIDQYRNL